MDQFVCATQKLEPQHDAGPIHEGEPKAAGPMVHHFALTLWPRLCRSGGHDDCEPDVPNQPLTQSEDPCLRRLKIRLIRRREKARWDRLIRQHHYRRGWCLPMVSWGGEIKAGWV